MREARAGRGVGTDCTDMGMGPGMDGRVSMVWSGLHTGRVAESGLSGCGTLQTSSDDKVGDRDMNHGYTGE